MRTLFTIALLLLSLSSQAATLASARLKVDTWLTNQWPTITARQDTYLAGHGRYWQGLLTCTGTNTIPNFTAASDGDNVQGNLESKPHYEAESIADIFPELVGMNLPAAFLCDQYVGPFGAGYTITVWVRFNGVIYTRSKTVGAEKWRDSDWAVWNPGMP